MVNRNFLLKIIVFLKIMILFTHNLQADANTFRLSVDFKNEIEKNNLQMIIYYNSNFYTMTHLTDEEIRNGYYEYKIIINTKILNNNLIKIIALNNVDFEQGPHGSWMDAEANRRIVCDFINDKNEMILSFTFGYGNYTYLNSTIIKRNCYLREFLGFFLNDTIEFYIDYPEIH